MNTKSNKKNCKKSHIMIVAALILSAIFTTSCATTINLRVTRPAQVNSFGAESIAILPFGTEGSRRLSKRNGKKIPVIDFFVDLATNEGEQKDIANYMKTELEADFAKSPYLTLIDSSRVLESLKNGNDSPADIYLTGDIISLTSRDKNIERKEKRGQKTVINNYHKRIVHMKFNYQIIDGRTSKVLHQEQLNISRESSEQKEDYSLPSAYDLIIKSIGNDLKDIVHKIQPYDVNKTIFLKKPDKNSPDMKNADLFAKDGDLKSAYEIFLVVYREDGIFESGYNAAALLEAMQRFEEAKTLAEELAEKYGTRKVQRLLDDINYEIEMAEKFELQRGPFSQIQTE
jgi:hypothetical protein